MLNDPNTSPSLFSQLCLFGYRVKSDAKMPFIIFYKTADRATLHAHLKISHLFQVNLYKTKIKHFCRQFYRDIFPAVNAESWVLK